MSTATDATLIAAARLDEESAALEHARNRAVSLNVEVRRRDQVIADLRSELAEARVELAAVHNELTIERARVSGAHASDAAQRAEEADGAVA